MLLLRPTSRACFFNRALTTAILPSASSISQPNNLLDRLRVLCNRGHLEEAISLFYTIKKPHCHQTYATLFQACARNSCLHHGQTLHHHMLTHNPKSSFDLYVSNHLINMYAKCGSLDYAHHLFDEMPHRNIVSWTALISGYAQHGRPDECFSLFSDMLAYYLPTEFAYASVLTLCDSDRGKQVHALALKTSFDAYVYVANALITMYSKNFSCGGLDEDEALTIFNEMKFRNLITWNSILAGFQTRGLWAEAVKYFNLMMRDGVGFDRASLLTVISSLCGANNNIDDISSLNYCFQLHCLTIKSGFISEIGVTTSLTKAYSNLGGEIADCYNLFMETSENRDIMSWTGIMTAFADRDPEESIFLFCQLQQEGLKPDRYTFSVVLKACASLVTDRHSSAVHSLVIKSGLNNDPVLANSLIHAYARTGSITRSKQVFQDMGYRDTVSWNSMLKAYGVHGQAKEALGLFSQMKSQPDETTFVALLSACSHAGLVSDGTQIFKNMVEIYNIAPQLDHFACMVDILARAGRVDEAMKIITQMPMKPDSVVWSSLLGACRKHGKPQLANLAAAKLKELDPENSLGYVLMSNIYCSAGSFSEAGHMRKEMKNLGVRKRPGLSWVEIGNRVHEFGSGGLRHPEGEIIRVKLEEFVERLKGLGYVAETSLVLHDVEEEHKEEQLYYHSEKLALVFFLMNNGGFNGGGRVIRIIKNIRICVDCHNFMKFASDLVKREIIVRDSNRFHHFNGRVCSCDDFW